MPSLAKKRLTVVAVSVVVFFVGILLKVLEPVKDIPVHIFAYIVAYFIAAAGDVLSAAKSIKQAKLLDEKFLVIAVSILSLYRGEYVLAVLMVVLYSLGETFANEKENRFLKVYTRVTVALSLAIAVIPVFFGVKHAVSFKIAMMVFTIICPLVLGIVKFIKRKCP